MDPFRHGPDRSESEIHAQDKAMKPSIAQQALLLAEIGYKRSGEFNGLPLITIQRALECHWEDLREALIQIIEAGMGAIIWPEISANTHIKLLAPLEAKRQVAYLQDLSDCPPHTCLYPSPTYLEENVERDEYRERPYTLELALGQPQLAFRTFDLHILETYRNDPRYKYSSTEIAGSISISDEYYGSQQIAPSDQILLQSFGFAYDDQLYRVVAVYLRYLSDLSPEHQQIWKAREVSGTFRLHPDYYRSSILGEFPEHASIFEAFTQELQLINKMCQVMGRPSLFRTDFGEYGEAWPQKFSFLLRPTLEEYNAFVHLLDKLLSDNISKKFFRDDVALEEELERSDGKIEVRPKGTIRLLDEWCRTACPVEDRDVWDQAIADLKAIRQARQKPAHHVEPDVFDYELIPKQREIMKRAYTSLRTIRMTLEKHPAVATDDSIEIPNWLRDGKIWAL